MNAKAIILRDFEIQHRYLVFAAILLMTFGCGMRSSLLPRIGGYTGAGGSLDGHTDGSLGGPDSGSPNQADANSGLPDLADANSDDRNTAADASETVIPQLSLLAGGLGGPGDQDGIGASAGFHNPSGVLSDGAGNLFVSDLSNHTIRKVVVATGVVTTLAGLPGDRGTTDGVGSAARFSGPSGLAMDGAGNLFVADLGKHTIRKIVIATGAVTTLAGSAGNPGATDGVASVARFSSPKALASDGVGNLFVADTNNHTIRKVVIATGAVSTIAGSAEEMGTTDGIGTAARFASPYGIAADGAGNLFVSDTGNHTLRKIVIASGVVTTLAGSPGEAGMVDGTGSTARFNNPSGLTTDGMGHLFVADVLNYVLRKVDIATGTVTTLAGSAINPGADDGMGTAARFNTPYDVTSDGSGNLFVADFFNHTIRKVVIASGAVTTLAGAAASTGTDDGRGAAARFYAPQGLADDGAGNLFVADTINHTIRTIVISTGTVTTFAGTAGFSGNGDGTGTAAQFNYPCDVTSDGAGNLFVADWGNCAIRRIVLLTGAVTTLAGGDVNHCGNTDGTGTAARFNGPSGVASDGSGNLFVADFNNHTIRKVVVATATVTTFAGSANLLGGVDGIGTAAQFYVPSGIASDGAGNLFVTDYYNHTIRKIDIATAAVTTLAGSPGNSGSADGTGTAARFYYPTGVASDRAGNLFVADSMNHAIRKIVVAAQTVSTLVGVPGRQGILLGPLPGELDTPAGLTFSVSGQLFIAEQHQNAVLAAQF